MLGDGRLRFAEHVDELTCGERSVAERIEDLASLRLRQGLKHIHPNIMPSTAYAVNGNLGRWAVHTRIAVDASTDEELAMFNPTVGVVECIDADHCLPVTGADRVEIIAAYSGMPSV